MAEGKRFEEDLLVLDLAATSPANPPEPPDEEQMFRALVLGVRDYMRKCGFKSAVLGLSGGIDSALVACLAVEALGRESVGVSLPSEYSSQGSLDDARVLARNLGIRYDVIPIQPCLSLANEGTVENGVSRTPAEDTEENIQARLRGVILMALSNKFGSLLLTTGNKSELAVGYCTLYGDMCGGLAVISDVPKTMVYRLARWINREREHHPAGVHHQAAVGGTAPQPDRPGLAAAVRGARRDPRRIRGATKSLAEIVASGIPEATCGAWCA